MILISDNVPVQTPRILTVDTLRVLQNESTRAQSMARRNQEERRSSPEDYQA